eukprot:Gb_01855 [translate_table: standard]
MVIFMFRCGRGEDEVLEVVVVNKPVVSLGRHVKGAMREGIEEVGYLGMEFVKLFESLWHLLPTPCFKACKMGAPRVQKLQQMFPSIVKCSSESRENQSVVSDLDGTLLRSSSSFSYFMLMAFEAGSPIRAFLLLLVSPIVWFLYHFVSEAAGIQVLIFMALAGLKVTDVTAVARAVLPKFYLEDMHSQSYKFFVSCGKKYIVTANPRIMVESFLVEYLNVDYVMGTELQVMGGYCSGLVTNPGVLIGVKKQKAVKEYFGEKKPDIGLGDRLTDYPFMSVCKEAYMVPSDKKVDAVPREQYLKPLVFHDGRLAFRPTPLASFVMFLWFPVGIILALMRTLVGLCLPYSIAVPVGAFLGVRLRVKGVPPIQNRNNYSGVLYVCSHRTLLDPIFLTTALRRPVTAVTYSLSRMSEILAPIKTVRLTRNRNHDGHTMQTLLNEGDLVVCPEGTTCREPYLLRFSSLFAELADDIVPVTMNATVSMFYGTTARGLKCLDPMFFLMNPCPRYDVEFLEKLPKEMTCSGGKSSFQVANHIQKKLADALGFECTNFTRRDKYMMLAGNEGIVPERKSYIQRRQSRVC